VTGVQTCALPILDSGDLIVTLTKKETLLYNTRLALNTEMKIKVKSLHAVLPMVIKPYELVNNSDNPYMTVKYKSIVTKQAVDDDLPLNLEHINRMNSIPMAVSKELLALLPDSNPPTKFELAVRFCAEKEHYFTHYYDSRGRTYCHGYYLSTQGTDLQKSLSVINEAHVIPLD
jgi:DNA-directed RNA polymerase